MATDSGSVCSFGSYCDNYLAQWPATYQDSTRAPHRRCNCGNRIGCATEDYLTTCLECRRRAHEAALAANANLFVCAYPGCPNTFYDVYDYVTTPPPSFLHGGGACASCAATLGCLDAVCPDGLCATCCEARTFDCGRCGHRYPAGYGCGHHLRPPGSWHGVTRAGDLCCFCCPDRERKMPCVACGAVRTHKTVGASRSAAMCGRCDKRLMVPP